MELPTVFLSSTIYDLEFVRQSIHKHISGLNYKTILSELGDVFFNPNEHTHQSCINSVSEADFLVFVISKRLGSRACPSAIDMVDLEKIISDETSHYSTIDKGEISISQLEVLKAIHNNIPIITFVEQEINYHYQTYYDAQNEGIQKDIAFPGMKKENTKYIFEFLKFLKNKKKNNAIYYYKDHEDVKTELNNYFAAYFKNLLVQNRENTKKNKGHYILAKVVEHISKDRSEAFHDLFSEIDKNDEIRILGTGITRFLSQEEVVHGYLKNNNIIKILLVNDQIIKSDYHCTSEDFITSLNNSFDIQIGKTIQSSELKVFCPLSDLNFLIDYNHFNNYFARKEYITKVKESYHLVKSFQEDINKNNWEGKMEARHFKSFIPMSITAIFPNENENNRKLLAEFLIPFTDNRLIIKSSLIENPNLYTLYMDFFNETWIRSTPI